jgi:hypothetical protein
MSVETSVLFCTFVNLVDSTPGDYRVHITSHMWPKETVSHQQVCFIKLEMAS